MTGAESAVAAERLILAEPDATGALAPVEWSWHEICEYANILFRAD